MYFVYIIQSERTSKWYYGHTNDLVERLRAHNSGWNKSTMGRGPWSYIFQKWFASLEEAVKFEKQLKKLRNKLYISRKYSSNFIR